MIDLARRKKNLKYMLGGYPSVWQLPNAVKIFEFLELTRDYWPSRGQRVLDLGCGKALQTQLLATKGAKVTGIDPSVKRHNSALKELRWSRVRRNVHLICGTLEEDTFAPLSLDSVASFCVLEHLPNLKTVLSTIYKSLRPGGDLHATVDSLSNLDDKALLDQHRREHAVVQYFTPDSIQETLNAAGFQVTETRYILTSDLARTLLIDELTTGNYLLPAEDRREAVRELVAAEEASASRDRGTMILVRAKKR